MKSNSFNKEEVLTLAKKAYDESIAHFEIDPGKCALLVIDMQDEFVKPEWTPSSFAAHSPTIAVA